MAIELNSKKLTPQSGQIVGVSMFGAPRPALTLSACHSGQPVYLSALSKEKLVVSPVMGVSNHAPYGVIARDMFNDTYEAGKMVNVASFGAEEWVLAGENIVAGSMVEYDPTNNYYINYDAQGDGNPIGYALQTVNAGEMVKISITCPLGAIISGSGETYELVVYIEASDWLYDSEAGIYYYDVDISGTQIGEDFQGSFVDSMGYLVSVNFVLNDGVVTVQSSSALDGAIDIIG